MSKPKHTPGPWEPFKQTVDQRFIEIRHVVGVPLARTVTASSEDVANAQLMAAAPELLFAVEAVMTGLMYPNTPGTPTVAELLKLCLKAANKAKGIES